MLFELAGEVNRQRSAELSGLLKALAGTNVPHPKFHAYCDDAAVIGAPFYIMAMVDGWVRPGHPSTPGYTDPAYPVSGRQRR